MMTLPSVSTARPFAQRAARAVRRFVRAEGGATMAEYALLIGAIVVVALLGAKAFGTSVNTKFVNDAARVANP